jgi:uncharacterized protein YecT (DUF1311 family)
MKYLAMVLFIMAASSPSFAQKPAQHGGSEQRVKTVEAELNHVYVKVMEKAASDPTAVAKIKTAEEAWKAYRDAYLDAMYPSKDKQSDPEADLVRAKLIQRQVAALRDLLQNYSK